MQDGRFLNADMVEAATGLPLNVLAGHDPTQTTQAFLDFTSGYVQRASALLPKQGAASPWRVHQNYVRDVLALRFGSFEDGVLRFN